MSDEPTVDYFEITYLLGKIERVTAEYFLQNGEFINFKSHGGKVVYAVRTDAILTCETIYKDRPRLVSNPNLVGATNVGHTPDN